MNIIDDVENRLEVAKKGIHNSQDWDDDDCRLPDNITYNDWIEGGFNELRAEFKELTDQLEQANAMICGMDYAAAWDRAEATKQLEQAKELAQAQHANIEQKDKRIEALEAGILAIPEWASDISNAGMYGAIEAAQKLVIEVLNEAE